MAIEIHKFGPASLFQHREGHRQVGETRAPPEAGGGGIDNKFANSINVPSRTKGGVKAVRSMERQGDQEPPPRGHQQRTYRHNIKHHRFDNVSQPGGEGGDRLSINRASTFGRHPKGGEGQCLYEWPCPNGASTSHRLGIDKAARVATRDREVACEYVNVNVNV